MQNLLQYNWFPVNESKKIIKLRKSSYSILDSKVIIKHISIMALSNKLDNLNTTITLDVVELNSFKNLKIIYLHSNECVCV